MRSLLGSRWTKKKKLRGYVWTPINMTTLISKIISKQSYRRRLIPFFSQMQIMFIDLCLKIKCSQASNPSIHVLWGWSTISSEVHKADGFKRFGIIWRDLSKTRRILAGTRKGATPTRSGHHTRSEAKTAGADLRWWGRDLSRFRRGGASPDTSVLVTDLGPW